MTPDRGDLFGTDGIRGVANTELTPDLALQLGRAAGSWLDGRAPVVVGRDTRRSGEMLSGALQAGFHSAGVDTIDVGILPSGGISHLTAESDAAMGVVVSASHNPAADNGIKLLGPAGVKLTDDEESAIERRLGRATSRIPFGPEVGTRAFDDRARHRYVEHLASGATFRFNGIPVVLDCANGAAFQAGPELFRRLGADVTVTAAEPTGMNINEGCGATAPEALAALAEGRVGLAFDGDADRLIAVDEQGSIVNGDRIMAVVARDWKKKGALRGDIVVTTVMANLGFRRAMEAIGVQVFETKVGDRYVLEGMRSTGAVLGGEQSGHVIFADRGRTGDGLLTGIRLLEIMAGSGKTLATLSAEAMQEFPQVLVNVPVADRTALDHDVDVQTSIADVEAELGSEGRVLVRASGTEPLVRVMVEASSDAHARRYADGLAEAIRSRLGAGAP